MKQTWILSVLLATAVWGQDNKLPGAGKTIELDLGKKRVNWTNAKWEVLPLDKPVDLRAFAGLRVTVTTDQPRSDAGVYVALREEDGTWYEHPWAVNLTQKENAGTALFADFSTPDWHQPADGTFNDQNMLLDVDKINAIAFGCVNPLGVGPVKFTVKEVALVPVLKGEPAPAKVEVTGKLLDVNGTTCIPAGVFGGFSLPQGAHTRYRLAMNRALFHGGSFGSVAKTETTPILVNCYGDRGTPSPMVRDAKWAEKLTAQATAAATAAKATGKPYHVEWWNEAYLNWANRNRAMFDPMFFDESKAVEGGPAHLKSDGSECPHLKWTRNPDVPLWLWMDRFSRDDRDNWRRGVTANGGTFSSHAPPFFGQGRGPYAPNTHPPKDAKDGEKYTVTVKGKEIELTAMTPWWVYDDTQFTFWSASGAVRLYAEPFLVAGKALKAAYPETTFIGGWCLRPSEDHWAAFRLAYQPVIDYGHEVMDGVTDHDYGGDAIKMPSSYELVTAYGMTKYGKWLTSWNTECASGTDPSVYGEEKALANHRKFQWTARKLLHMLQTVPDKARSIAWFGTGEAFAFNARGEGVLFTMLMNLRGKLVQVQTSDPQLYAVAGIDGTDPATPRPEDLGDAKELVVAVFNDNATTRPVEMTITAPKGTQFNGLTVRRPIFQDDGNTEIEEKTEKVTGTVHTFKADLPAHHAIALTFTLTGTVGDKPEVRRRQFFSPALLVDVTPDKPSAQKIEVKADDLKSAKRAWLRIVTERLADGEGIAVINGKEYALPKAVTPENAPWIRQIPVTVADLKEQNEVTFKVSSPAHAGYLVATASLSTESE